MKVLLVDPPQLFLSARGLTRQVQPLGLAYIGAYLASDHDIAFLLPDTRAYTGAHPWREIADAIALQQPDVVAISAVTATFPAAARLAREVKMISADIVTVIGGPHVSADPAAALTAAPALDFAVQGEGELTLAELLQRLAKKNANADYAGIAGLIWRDPRDLQIRRNKPRPPISDLDSLPFPLRDNLLWRGDIQPAFYQAMITLRGCPYQCIYCAIPLSEGKKTRYRSAQNIIAEIEYLRARYRIPDLFFHDSVFTLHRRRTMALCEQMIERDATIAFHCQTRADRVDDELLDKMKAAGCAQIFFGIESGDPDSLTQIRKKMALHTIRDAVAMVKRRDIRCTGFFMVGFPWENETSIDKTIDFALDLGLDAVSLFSATPLPGTELWHMTRTIPLPDSIDYTTPQVNLTALDNARYGEVFQRAKLRVETYNQEQMMARAAVLQRNPLAAGNPVRRNWLE